MGGQRSGGCPLLGAALVFHEVVPVGARRGTLKLGVPLQEPPPCAPLDTHHWAAPWERSISARSSCTWGVGGRWGPAPSTGQEAGAPSRDPTPHKPAHLPQHFPLSGHEGRAGLHRHVQLSPQRLVQGQLPLEPGRRGGECACAGGSPHPPAPPRPTDLSLKSGCRVLFFCDVFLLVARLLSGSSRRDT